MMPSTPPSMTTQPSQQSPASTRSTTTFSAGATLTIATTTSTTLVSRHPRTVPIRRAESRAKALLSDLSEKDFIPSQSALHIFVAGVLLTLTNLLPLIPIGLHILHRNALITILAHIPAAVLGLLIHFLLTLYPHTAYLALTESRLIQRPRGLLSNIRIHPLSILRTFTHNGNVIEADAISNNICLKAPDKQTASAAVTALNTALTSRNRPQPPDCLLQDHGEVVITANTPLCEYEPPSEKIEVKVIGDRVHVRTRGPRFPQVFLIFAGLLVTHAVAVVLLLFVFEDLPRQITPITASMISALSLGGVYVASVILVLIWYLIRSIPRKWNLIMVGYRKDVKTGMIDVGKCREVVLVRNAKGFGVRLVSTTGNCFLDVGGLSEGEAMKLVSVLREIFPSLFRGSV